MRDGRATPFSCMAAALLLQVAHVYAFLHAGSASQRMPHVLRARALCETVAGSLTREAGFACDLTSPCALSQELPVFVRLLMSLADPLTLSLGAAPLHDLPQLCAMHTMHCLEAARRIAAAAMALHRCQLIPF